MYRKMRRKPAQHVVPHMNGWAVKAEGSGRASKVFSEKTAAIDYAQQLALRQETNLVVHNEDGTFRRSRIAAREPLTMLEQANADVIEPQHPRTDGTEAY